MREATKSATVLQEENKVKEKYLQRENKSTFSGGTNVHIFAHWRGGTHTTNTRETTKVLIKESQGHNVSTC